MTQELAPAPATVGHAQHTESLRRTAMEVLRPHVRPAEPCALVEFPNYGNVGDSAIWLGERALLANLGARVAYTSEMGSFRPDWLRASVPGGTIFLQGGGNLGDLWPDHQAFRERVVAEFHDSPIVQLPQSIHFEDRRNLDRARRVFDAHPRLTLLVRERRSLEIARAEFAAPSALCPDMAYGLGPLRRSAPPVHDVVSLVRRDKEAAGASAGINAAQGEVLDWGEVDELSARWFRKALRPRLLRGQWRRVIHVYDALARRRLRAGVRMLSRGRVALTDRLHGHVLCVLLGIPHVAMDNSYGKISSLVETWTSGLPFVRLAESPEQARVMTQALLDGRNP